MRNALNWFEIPATDFERAVAFYERITGEGLQRIEFMGVAQAFFTFDQEAVGGAIVADTYLANHPMAPSRGGAVVYLNANGRLDAILERVEAAGGSVVIPATPILFHPPGPWPLFLIVRATGSGCISRRRSLAGGRGDRVCLV